MPEPPIPNVLAMLLCDHVIVEEGTRKKSLIGLFENVYTLKFPAVTNCAIYFKLADAEGHYDLKIRAVNLKDENLVGEIMAGAEVQTRLATAEFVIQFLGLPFPEAGKYEFQLYANEMYLARVTLNLLQISPGENPWQQQR